MVELLTEQNQLLKSKGQSASEENHREHEAEVREVEKCLQTHHDEVLMLRSITSNSFKSIFRPVGRSADRVAILRGADYTPVGAVDKEILGRIQAEALDDDVSILVGIVNSFSKTSKVGHVYVPDDGRSYRFEYTQKGPLDPEDIFSWSQYYGSRITLYGRFVRFFDGKVKKFIVYTAEKTANSDQDILK